MFQRIISWLVNVINTTWSIVTRLTGVGIAVAAVLIICDVLFGTQFAVLQRAATVIGTTPLNVLVGGLVVYFLAIKK
jgi:hypothetical protein